MPVREEGSRGWESYEGEREGGKGVWGGKHPGPPCSKGTFSKAMGEFLSPYQPPEESPVFQEWACPGISAELVQGLGAAQWELA